MSDCRSSSRVRTRSSSRDSCKTSRTISSESALERLQSGLDKIGKPTTIELRRSPRKSQESKKTSSQAPIFRCQKCNFVSYPTFAELVQHMMLSHDPPAGDFPGFRKIERKNYDCPICKFPFANAFKMKQHMDKKDCIELADDEHLANQKLSLKDNRGFHLCQMCDFKCKDAKVINQHIRDGHYPHRDCFVSSDPRLRQLGQEFRETEMETLNQTNLARAKAVNEHSRANRRPKKQPKSTSQASSSSHYPSSSAIRRFPASKEDKTNPARFAQDQFQEAERHHAQLAHLAQTQLMNANFQNAAAFSASPNFLFSSQQNFLHPNSSQTPSESNNHPLVPPNLLPNGANSPFHLTFYQNYLQQIQRMLAERFFGQRW